MSRRFYRPDGWTEAEGPAERDVGWIDIEGEAPYDWERVDRELRMLDAVTERLFCVYRDQRGDRGQHTVTAMIPRCQKRRVPTWRDRLKAFVFERTNIIDLTQCICQDGHPGAHCDLNGRLFRPEECVQEPWHLMEGMFYGDVERTVQDSSKLPPGAKI